MLNVPRQGCERAFGLGLLPASVSALSAVPCRVMRWPWAASSIRGAPSSWARCCCWRGKQRVGMGKEGEKQARQARRHSHTSTVGDSSVRQYLAVRARQHYPATRSASAACTGSGGVLFVLLPRNIGESSPLSHVLAWSACRGVPPEHIEHINARECRQAPAARSS